MNALMTRVPALPAMAASDVARVQELQDYLLQLDQVSIQTTHHFHAGLYSRTIRVPAGVVITGALIKIPTLLIFSGYATIYVGGESLDLCGYHVLPGQAGRKQVFAAHLDTDLTMVFATTATTIEQAEAEFTDETNSLMSRQQCADVTHITGE